MWKPKILNKIEKMGYKVFDDGDYDLNIIGVRNLENNPNEYDDKLHVCYLLKGSWREHIFQVSTDPGSYWLTKEDYKGCAIYKHPQQARGAYMIGKHCGKYDALVQVTPVEYWRDWNKDNKADFEDAGKVHKAKIGLNIHRSTTLDVGSHEVNRWSAGCIVFSRKNEFDIFMELCRNQVKHLNYRTFSFTLIAE
tara:strand:- start:400 stop:981 length:582 start_codon:yes stop_codon:yes gene_type:complete